MILFFFLQKRWAPFYSILENVESSRTGSAEETVQQDSRATLHTSQGERPECKMGATRFKTHFSRPTLETSSSIEVIWHRTDFARL